MSGRTCTLNRSGFTLIEVCIIIVVVAMVALVLIPAKSQRRAHARRIESVNDLKMVGLAFRLFETDHDDRMPMEVPKEEGGVAEIFERGSTKQIYRTFLVMSNDLGNSPEVLVDAADSETVQATTFHTNPVHGDPEERVVFDGNVHTSFGIGPEASDLKPGMILSGNRHIEDEKAGFEYGKDLIARVGTNNPSVHFASDAVHRGNGNILLGDGSVQQYSSQDLREQLRTTGDADNFWAQPGNSHP